MGVVIDAGLVGYGKRIAPSISLISLLAPLAIILVYALLAVVAPPILDRLHPRIIKLSILLCESRLENSPGGGPVAGLQQGDLPVQAGDRPAILRVDK